ncbi:MAG: hypothetical protein L0Y56_21650, partial [Nitrospira sp.]|nr:hypothetical protein [Nitrospira sp.]
MADTNSTDTSALDTLAAAMEDAASSELGAPGAPVSPDTRDTPDAKDKPIPDLEGDAETPETPETPDAKAPKVPDESPEAKASREKKEAEEAYQAYAKHWKEHYDVDISKYPMVEFDKPYAELSAEQQAEVDKDIAFRDEKPLSYFKKIFMPLIRAEWFRLEALSKAHQKTSDEFDKKQKEFLATHPEYADKLP